MQNVRKICEKYFRVLFTLFTWLSLKFGCTWELMLTIALIISESASASRFQMYMHAMFPKLDNYWLCCCTTKHKNVPGVILRRHCESVTCNLCDVRRTTIWRCRMVHFPSWSCKWEQYLFVMLNIAQGTSITSASMEAKFRLQRTTLFSRFFFNWRNATRFSVDFSIDCICNLIHL